MATFHHYHVLILCVGALLYGAQSLNITSQIKMQNLLSKVKLPNLFRIKSSNSTSHPSRSHSFPSLLYNHHHHPKSSSLSSSSSNSTSVSRSMSRLNSRLNSHLNRLNLTVDHHSPPMAKRNGVIVFAPLSNYQSSGHKQQHQHQQPMYHYPMMQPMIIATTTHLSNSPQDYHPRSMPYQHQNAFQGVVQVVDEATPFANFIRHHLMNPAHLASLLQLAKYDKKVIVHHIEQKPKYRPKPKKPERKRQPKKKKTYSAEKPSKFDDFKKEFYAIDPYDSFYYDPKKDTKSGSKAGPKLNPEDVNAAILEAFSPAWAESMRYPSVVAFDDNPEMNMSASALFNSPMANGFFDGNSMAATSNSNFKWFHNTRKLHPRLMLPTVAPTAQTPSLFYHSEDDYSNPIYQQMPILTKDTRMKEAPPIGLNVHNATNVLYVVKIEPRVVQHSVQTDSANYASQVNNKPSQSQLPSSIQEVKAKLATQPYSPNPVTSTPPTTTTITSITTAGTPQHSPQHIPQHIPQQSPSQSQSPSQRQSRYQKTHFRTFNVNASPTQRASTTLRPVHSSSSQHQRFRSMAMTNTMNNNDDEDDNMWTSSRMTITNDQQDLEAIPSVTEYSRVLPPPPNFVQTQTHSRKRPFLPEYQIPSTQPTTTTTQSTNHHRFGSNDNVKLVQVVARMNVKPNEDDDQNRDHDERNDDEHENENDEHNNERQVVTTISTRKPEIYFPKRGIVIDDYVGLATDPMFKLVDGQSSVKHKLAHHQHNSQSTLNPKAKVEPTQQKWQKVVPTFSPLYKERTPRTTTRRSNIIRVSTPRSTTTSPIRTSTSVNTILTTNKPKRNVFKFDLNSSLDRSVQKAKRQPMRTTTPEPLSPQVPPPLESPSETTKLAQVYSFMSERTKQTSNKPEPTRKAVKSASKQTKSNVAQRSLLSSPSFTKNKKEESIRNRQSTTTSTTTKSPILNNEVDKKRHEKRDSKKPMRTSCKNKGEGFHADLWNNCKTYYRCDQANRATRLTCPPGTKFSQAKQVCDFSRDVRCP